MGRILQTLENCADAAGTSEQAEPVRELSPEALGLIVQKLRQLELQLHDRNLAARGLAQELDGLIAGTALSGRWTEMSHAIMQLHFDMALVMLEKWLASHEMRQE